MNNVIRIDECSAFTPGRAGYRARSDDVNRLAELLTLLGAGEVEGPALSPEFSRLVQVRQLHAGDTLFHEGAPAEAIYFVRAGTFKVLRTAEDGYEQVLGFCRRSEVLGYDALCQDGHPSGAVALEDASVYTVTVPDLDLLGQGVPAFDVVVHRAASRALSARCDLAALMSAVSAEVRLARFLLDLSQRMSALGESPRRFHLRMCRRDIASYLGVAHETVSRSFSVLAARDLVKVEQREVEILDMAGLQAFACNTRRRVDESWRQGGALSRRAKPSCASAQPLSA